MGCQSFDARYNLVGGVDENGIGVGTARVNTEPKVVPGKHRRLRSRCQRMEHKTRNMIALLKEWTNITLMELL